MPITLRHRIAFHALTASLVLNLVLGVSLDRIVAGRVTVQPSSQHASLIESVFP